MKMIRTIKPFTMGQIVATPGALEALEKAGESAQTYLERHAKGDWGEVCLEDWKANDDALKDGSRLLSAYKLKDGTKIWLITEAAADDDGNRAATTLLLPREY
jgi:hypothetical protein